MNDRNGPYAYFACLASYNAGILYGAWINAAQEPEAILEDIRAMLKSSPEPDAEEWAIHDYEGFCGYKVDEWEDIETLSSLGVAIDQSDNPELLMEVFDHVGTTIDDAQEYIDDNYQGCHKDLSDYAYEFTQDTEGSSIPKHLAPYIDYEAMGRDWDLSGDIWTVSLDDGMHIFTNA